MLPMKTRLLTLLAATALAGTGLSAPGIAAGGPQVVGINAAVLNNVRIKSAGAAQARIAVVRQRVALADEVQTGGRSQLQVLLLDKSVFTVGANARLVIDRFVYDPNRGARGLTASVVTGAFRFLSGKPDRAGTTAIRTPIASIGVRGTIVEGVVGPQAVLIAAGEAGIGRDVRSDPETASLIILRGPGKRTQGRVLPGVIDVTAGGRTVTVDRPMHAVYVPAPGMAPIGPFAISPEGLRQVQALLFPSLAQEYALTVPGEDARPSGTGFVPTERPRPTRFRPGFFPGPDGPDRGPGPQSYIPTLPNFPAGGEPTGQQSPQSQKQAPPAKSNSVQDPASPPPPSKNSPPGKPPGKP